MIFGIGNDLCDVRRIEGMLARHGERLVGKLLAPSEAAEFQQRRARWPARGSRYLASRIAAKEAFSKAIGLGLRLPMRWLDCEVVLAPSGQPRFALHGALALWFKERGLVAHLSLSDESDHAAAFVVIEILNTQPASAAPAETPAAPAPSPSPASVFTELTGRTTD